MSLLSISRAPLHSLWTPPPPSIARSIELHAQERQILPANRSSPTVRSPFGQDRLIPIWVAVLALRQKSREVRFDSAAQMLDFFRLPKDGFHQEVTRDAKKDWCCLFWHLHKLLNGLGVLVLTVQYLTNGGVDPTGPANRFHGADNAPTS